MTAQRKRLLKFAILSLPSTIIAARTWLWIMGICEPIPEANVVAGVLFSVCNYFGAAFCVWGMDL